jgi:hypothetical protein
MINSPAVMKVKDYFLFRSLSAMILVKAAKMPQTMPMKKALTGSYPNQLAIIPMEPPTMTPRSTAWLGEFS